MLGYFCGTCEIQWPNTNDFAKCPGCHKQTRSATGKPLTAEEAKLKVREFEFDAWYERREKKRVGPTPEERGMREAKRQARELRELEEAFRGEG